MWEEEGIGKEEIISVLCEELWIIENFRVSSENLGSPASALFFKSVYVEF